MGAPPARASEGWGTSTHLRSEVEEQGDAADDLAQPQAQKRHEHGARGGGGRRRRRRGVQGALVRGAAAAHLLRAAQVLGVVSAGAAHGSSAPSHCLPGCCARGQGQGRRGAGAGPGGPRRGALGARRCSRARGRAGRAPGRPGSYKALREGRPGEPISPGRGRRLHSHAGLPSLPCALPLLLSLPRRPPPPRPSRRRRLWVVPRVPDATCPSSAAFLEVQERARGRCRCVPWSWVKVTSQTRPGCSTPPPQPRFPLEDLPRRLGDF